MEQLLKIQGLGKSYEEAEVQRVVLKDLDLDVAPSELVLIAGSSGSGKSTLLNIISGIDVPTTGSVYLGGKYLTEMSETARAKFRLRYIGFVFQFFNLIPTLRADENLALPLELLGFDRQIIRNRVEESLQRIGLAARKRSFPDRLSGGEQQRIAIARALIHQPAIVLADEPTGNLDLNTGAEVLSLFYDLVAQSRTSVLMVTHSKEAEPYADRMLDLLDYRLEERK
jgi:putative ABC transport system ATP-binding protein